MDSIDLHITLRRGVRSERIQFDCDIDNLISQINGITITCVCLNTGFVYTTRNRTTRECTKVVIFTVFLCGTRPVTRRQTREPNPTANPDPSVLTLCVVTVLPVIYCGATTGRRVWFGYTGPRWTTTISGTKVDYGVRLGYVSVRVSDGGGNPRTLSSIEVKETRKVLWFHNY